MVYPKQASPLPPKRGVAVKSGSSEDESVPLSHSPVADAQEPIEDEVRTCSELFAAYCGHWLLQEEGGLAILLTLLNEVFDVSAGDQWLRRQLSSILRQLLANALSDKMGRRITEALDSYASAERIADSIAQMR